MCPIFVGTTLAASYTQGAETDRRPNILFVFTDDQSHRTVGSYEEAPRWVQTPHIDRLANEGVRFVNAYAASWCLPSRAMILTGLHQHAIRGVTIDRNPNSRYDPRLCKFWPAELRKAGYTTAAIGKWHLSADTGHGRDWDHSVIWNHSVPDMAGGYFVDQKLNIDGGPYTSVGGYSTDNYTDHAVNFIRRGHEKPWCMWLCYDAVHHPFLPADRHRNHFQEGAEVTIPMDIYPPRPDKPRYVRNYGLFRPNGSGIPMLDRSNPLVPLDLKQAPDALPEAVRQYNRGVLAIDEGVGRLLEALDQSDQLDRTFIVFTSDQGFAWGQHGFAWKIAPYDANMCVPFIVRMPDRVVRGKTVAAARGGRPSAADAPAKLCAQAEPSA